MDRIERLLAEPVWDRSRTLDLHGQVHLARFFHRVGAGSELPAALRYWDILKLPWREALCDASIPVLAPAFALDGSTLECSLQLTRGRISPRFGVACGHSPSVPNEVRLERELRVLQQLRTELGASTELAEGLLTSAAGRDPRIEYLVGVDFRAASPLLKFYAFVPDCTTPEANLAATAELLAALGTPLAARALPPGSLYQCVSWDMTPSPASRLKLYLKPARTTLTALRSLAPDHADEIVEFATAATGWGETQLDGLAVGWSWVTLKNTVGGDALGVTFSLMGYLHGPLKVSPDGRVRSDGEIARRVVPTLESFGLPTDAYTSALDAFRRGPLDREHLMHVAVSLQWLDGQPAVSIYLGTRMYAHAQGMKWMLSRQPDPFGE